MKRFMIPIITGVMLFSNITPTVADTFDKFNQNPYTDKEPTYQIENDIIYKGPQTTMIPSTTEYVEWYGELPPDDWDPEPITIPYRKINTYILERFAHYLRYQINLKEYNMGALVSLYNRITPNLYNDDYLKLNYPMDAREIAWMSLDLDEALDWKKQSYWAMWRKYGRDISKSTLDLSEYFDYDYWKDNKHANDIVDEDYNLTEVQEAMLHAYMCKGLLSIPAWQQHPSPNKRFTPTIMNETSTRRDYTFFKGNVWDLAAIADKWYIQDQANYLSGEIDIKFGDEDLTTVDRSHLDRANNRVHLGQNTRIKESDTIKGVHLTENYFNAFDISVSHEHSVDSQINFISRYKSWIMKQVREDEPVSVKFKESMYKYVIQQLERLPNGDEKKRMLYMKDSLWWTIQYWVDSEYIS